MNMIDWYKKVVFENYANFSGRARRSEYWYFTLFNFLITLVLYIPMIAMGGFTEYNSEPSAICWLFYGLLMLYSLAVIIPSLAVAVRRLHDIGKKRMVLFNRIDSFCRPHYYAGLVLHGRRRIYQ